MKWRRAFSGFVVILILLASAPSGVLANSTDGIEPKADAPVGGSSAVESETADGDSTAEQPAEATAATEADGYKTPEEDAVPVYMVLPGGTTVSPETFYSTTLGRTMWYEVILPPGYAQSTRPYPVLYLLHGAAGGAHSWIELGLHRTADRLWSEGGLDKFIIVLPEGGNSYYINHAEGGPRWGDYIADDVVQIIDANYRTLGTPLGRAIGGLSMGGEGALLLGLQHADIFGIVGAHSPTTRLTYDEIPGPIYGDLAYWQRNNSLWLLQNTDEARRLKIWIDMGEDDPWLLSARALHETLNEAEVDHMFVAGEGGHEAEYWLGSQPDYLGFYASAFDEDSPLTAERLTAARAI